MNSIPVDRLSACLQQILPTPVGVAAIDVDEVATATIPSELVLQGVGTKRQREFAAGRFAARRAIGACGFTPVYPARGDDRQPLWPQGVVGSISHTDRYAVAAATGTSTAASLGIDLEQIRELRPGLPEKVLTPGELTLLRSVRHCADADVLKLFAFKESVYKAVYPVVGRYIGFREVEISPADDGLRASCVDPAHPVAGLVARLRGNALLDGNHIVAGCWLT